MCPRISCVPVGTRVAHARCMTTKLAALLALCLLASPLGCTLETSEEDETEEEVIDDEGEVDDDVADEALETDVQFPTRHQANIKFGDVTIP